ncbi:MAG: hypothetical protein ABI867_22520 [Kofleriaceae bacterium]
MTDDELRLLEEIRANPLDDQPRRVYADVLLARGDERGEYIQLALDRDQGHWDDHKGARWQELRARETEWTTAFGLGGIQHVVVHRGLPYSLTCSYELVLQHAEAINRLPITHLTLRGNGSLASIAALPGLSTLEYLSLGATGSDSIPHTPIPRDDLLALASVSLRSLRELALCDEALSDTAAGALANARWLGQLERFTIQGAFGAQSITGAGLSEIVARPLPRLRELTLQMTLGDRGARALATATLPLLERLTFLNAHLGDGAAHIFGSSVLAPVDYLHVSNDNLRDSIAALAAAPHAGKLRVLEVPMCQIDDRGTATLARSQSLPGLKYLSMHYNELGRDGVAALARATGMPKLTKLYLANNPFRTGAREYHEASEDSDTVSGWYDVPVPREELLALFAHRPGLQVSV